MGYCHPTDPTLVSTSLLELFSVNSIVRNVLASTFESCLLTLLSMQRFNVAASAIPGRYVLESP